MTKEPASLETIHAFLQEVSETVQDTRGMCRETIGLPERSPSQQPDRPRGGPNESIAQAPEASDEPADAAEYDPAAIKPLTGEPAHKAKVVRDYVEAADGKLELHFLPGYAPELNPDELVWNHMKRTGTARRPLTSGQSLQDRVEADLKAIQSNRTLVRSFFGAPDIAYITD